MAVICRPYGAALFDDVMAANMPHLTELKDGN